MIEYICMILDSNKWKARGCGDEGFRPNCLTRSGTARYEPEQEERI